MNEKEKLINLIQTAVGGCARNWAEIIADNLLANGVKLPPYQIGQNEFIEDTIYPLTITADRYNGTYSDGKFIAWNLDADEVPEGIYSDDCGCHEFWLYNEIICGKGRTVSEALSDLYIKLKKDGE